MTSADPSTCWIRRRWPATLPDDLHASLGPNPLCGGGVADAILIAAAAALDAEAMVLALIPVVGIIWSVEVSQRADGFRARAGENLTTGEATALAVNAAWQSGLGSIVPHLNRMIVGARFADSAATGRRGPSHLIMTGTPESNVDCYRAHSVEVQFPATTGAYLDFLERVRPAGPTFRQAGYISLRYSAPSRALISMHNLPAPVVVSIEFSSLAGLEASGDWVAFAEQTAAQLGGRPHWGQENSLTSAEVERLYGDGLERCSTRHRSPARSPGPSPYARTPWPPPNCASRSAARRTGSAWRPTAPAWTLARSRWATPPPRWYGSATPVIAKEI